MTIEFGRYEIREYNTAADRDARSYKNSRVMSAMASKGSQVAEYHYWYNQVKDPSLLFYYVNEGPFKI